MQRHLPIFTSAAIAAVLLGFFMYLQSGKENSHVMDLSGQWLFVAGLPILLGLIIGNYFKTFKGFGVELEPLLDAPVSTIKLNTLDAAENIIEEEKRTVEYLENLSPDKQLTITGLAFVKSKFNTYQAASLKRYLNRLPNLKYIEIKAEDGKFLSLIPINCFKDVQGKVNERSVNDFIGKLHDLQSEETTVVNDKLDELGSVRVITKSVSENESIFDVLEKVRKSAFGILPVVSQNGELTGVITDRLIEKRITDEVLRIQNQKK